MSLAVEQFIMYLYLSRLIENCESYGVITDDVLRDKLGIGVLGEGMNEKLQLDVDQLTIEKALSQVRASGLTSKDDAKAADTSKEFVQKHTTLPGS